MLVILLYVEYLCILFILIGTSVWLSYYPAISSSYAAITVLGLIITISLSQYSYC